MNGIPMRDLAVQFVVELDQLCNKIEGRPVFKNQLIRSGSSIGANIHEAKYAQSNADFISKFEIALKECYETEYWLEILLRYLRSRNLSTVPCVTNVVFCVEN